MSKMKVSIATLEIRQYKSVVEMAEHLERLIADAKTAGSEVVLFPEMGNVGLLWTDPSSAKLDPRKVGEAYANVLTPFFLPFQEHMSAIAAKYGIIVIGPSFWHATNGVGTNSAVVFFPDGSTHRQDKIHPTRGEFAIATQGGSSVGLFDIGDVKAAVLICYDTQFPELSRPLVDAGVQVLFVPSLTSHRAYWRLRYASHSRAQENQIFVCVSALAGNLGIPEELPLTAHGGAYVTCPIDNRFDVEDGLLAANPFDVESLLTVELDFDLLSLSRERGEIRNLRDRRPDIYAKLVV